MRVLLSVVGALCSLAGAAVLLVMLQYLISLARADAHAPLSMWAWHVLPGAALLVGGVSLLWWTRRLP